MKAKIAALTIVIAALAFGVFSYMRLAPVPKGSTPEEKTVCVLETNDCLRCHSHDAMAPWYAGLPVASSLVGKDMRNGTRYIDLQAVAEALKSGGKVSEVDVSKIEYAVSNDAMPPLQYSAVHWGSYLNSAEKAAVMEWVAKNRAEHARGSGVSAEFENEPVRPLMPAPKTDPRKVELGRLLYHDTRLSADNTISCATCHGLDTGGVDRLRYSKGVNGQLGGVNAPTVFNATFNHRQFWDGRAADLAEQAGGPPLNPVEMASASWEQIVEKLNRDEAFKNKFAEVYPEGLSGKTITDAIAEFEKTLVTPNSRFDKYLKGDKNALTKDEIEGYGLFKAAKCATCHTGHNLGGLSFEYMGVLNDYFADRGDMTDADKGLFNFEKAEKNVGKFKTPTLRNVALTPPYFHDGTVTSLEKAAAHMLKYQSGVRLSDADIKKIVLFLETLTGQYDGKPLAGK